MRILLTSANGFIGRQLLAGLRTRGHAVVGAKIGLPPRSLAIGFSLLDLAIGISLLRRLRPGLLAVVQILVVVGYTLGLSTLAPSLWLDPYGALLKNLPMLVAIGVWAALEEER